MRARIAKASVELIHVKGIRFTMSDLARQLGVSKRTLYEHFASKDEIIGFIINEAVLEIQRQEAEIYNNPQMNVIEKLRAVLALLPDDFKFIFTRLLDDIRRFHPQEWKKIDALLQHEWDTVEKLLEEGMASGHLRRTNVPALLQILKGATYSLFEPQYLAANKVTLEESVSTMVDIFLDGIVAAGTQPQQK
ncbi:TetR/AcrR family transcriptional regulator [Paenibacillus sp. GCM10027626]|uniref:TetR/AcrR family transcriptional regulator n=1 Tax=Paenibacillus sp. GCM10027626 TaxID=3273411 RepID=UPI00363C83D1